MFAGLTNQVSSWMGSSKGDPQQQQPPPEEKIVTPIDDAETTTDVTTEKKDISPTKHSKMEMFSNVKTQIEGIGGWIGSSIPKLRKGENAPPTEDAAQVVTSDADTMLTGEPVKSSSHQKDDDDNSSDTGGADSGPASARESPTEEVKDAQYGNVPNKAIAGAKSFGNFLYSAVNKAGKTVSVASAKIKETVEKNTILGEFNKEQEAFAKNQAANAENALPPWTGCSNEEALKEDCLSLSTDKRNFVRSPPAGVDFHFNYDVSYAVAMAIMEQDANLEKMRYELVPKVISEENFWRNYFYRVSLICQANELSFMSQDDAHMKSADQPQTRKSSEFISDTLQASKHVLAEVKEGMKILTMGPKTTDEDWEKELEAELHDYEVVSEHKSMNLKNGSLEKEIKEILDEDLK